MSLLKSLFSGDQEKNLNKGLEATVNLFSQNLERQLLVSQLLMLHY